MKWLSKLVGTRAPVAAGAAAGLVLVALWIPTVVAQEQGGGTDRADQTVAWLDAMLYWTIRGIEIVGIGTIVIGAVAASVTFLLRTLREGPTDLAYHNFRAGLGRAILLGLEFLVAADIIATVAIDPTLESVAVLAGVVAVRTFLSFALEVEIDGKWPWNKGSPRERQ